MVNLSFQHGTVLHRTEILTDYVKYDAEPYLVRSSVEQRPLHSPYNSPRTTGCRPKTQDTDANFNLKQQPNWTLAELGLAIEHNELFVEYQPLLELATGRITRMEALVRWQHPRLGRIAPSQFIPAAEESGLILSIGDWVLQTACAQCQQWQWLGFQEVGIAVNVSARQLELNGWLVKRVAQTLQTYGLAAQALELEVTETLAVQPNEMNLQTLQGLVELGVRLALDDFGTGHSSLTSLKRFPFQTLKLDRSFVQGVDQTASKKDRLILTSLLSLGKSLNLQVVAEGVETLAQRDFLRSLACDLVQGNWYSTPVSPEVATTLLRQTYL